VFPAFQWPRASDAGCHFALCVLLALVVSYQGRCLLLFCDQPFDLATFLITFESKLLDVLSSLLLARPSSLTDLNLPQQHHFDTCFLHLPKETVTPFTYPFSTNLVYQ